MVAIPQLVEEVLQYPPVAHTRGETVDALEVVLQILLDRVVVDERVICVDQETIGWGRVRSRFQLSTPANQARYAVRASVASSSAPIEPQEALPDRTLPGWAGRTSRCSRCN